MCVCVCVCVCPFYFPPHFGAAVFERPVLGAGFNARAPCWALDFFETAVLGPRPQTAPRRNSVEKADAVK